MTSYIFTDDLQCKTSSMQITVFPAGTFSGKVFLNDQRGKSGCEFSFVIGTSGPQEIDVKDADCGGVTKDEV